MPRMSKKLKHEWSLFLNHRGRRCYNSLCRRCIHSCKQSFRATVVECPRYFSKRAVGRDDYAYTSIDQLPITLCAEDVAQVLGISRAGAYTLIHSKGFLTIQIGKRMVVPKDKLLAWMEEQSAV